MINWIKRLAFFYIGFWSILAFALGEEIGSPADSFLVISDIHLNHHARHRMNFAPATATIDNDLDLQSLRYLMKQMQNDIQEGKMPHPQFILLLGDLVSHTRHSKTDVAENEHLVLSTIQQTFPETPVLYTFGNEDSFSANYGLFKIKDRKADYYSPLDIMKTVWGKASFLSTGAFCKYHAVYPCILKAGTTSGYYSAYLKPHLRLIALNSVMFSNKQIGYTNLDREAQLEWLEAQLREVEALHETALLVMHIPPGNNVYKSYFWSDAAFWNVDDQEKFNQLISDYHLSIIGILAGHTHKDEIKFFEHYAHTPIVGVYLNPSLSTSHANAPGVRSYLFIQNPRTTLWNLSDYTTYKFSMEKNNTLHSEVLYRYQAYYCDQKETQNLSDCLDKVTIEKVKRFMSVGNPNHKEIISDPKNIHIHKQTYGLHSMSNRFRQLKLVFGNR